MHWETKHIQQFDIQGPRYTSYPTAMQFHEEFSNTDWLNAIGRSNESHRPLSVYLHVPFCKQLCYYCACNKVVTQKEELARSYLDSLISEMELLSSHIPSHRPVKYLHLGGGTPTYLSNAELTELMYHLSRNFHLLEEERGEYSLEIDPREVDENKISLLRGLGFSRVSLGIQDFDEAVQKAVNREQPFEDIRKLMLTLTDYDFRSINFDLIYGLPHQTPESFKKTIDKVIALNPDRLSIFNYAHLPLRFKSQSLIKEEFLPSPEEKLQIFVNAANQLVDAGYHYLGMDHFAKPYDSLVEAQKIGSLHRNFQGYSTDGDADLLGLGVSAISQIDGAYFQNHDSIKTYQGLVDNGEIALKRGIVLSDDDKIRAWVISELMCHKGLSFNNFEKKFSHAFVVYFAKECQLLESLEKQGLLNLSDERIDLTELGEQLVRRVCMVFDCYNQNSPHFSRII